MTTAGPVPRIDSARLWGSLMETAGFGGTAKGGINRLTLGDEDRQVRDWFRSACEAAGCSVHVDRLGTMYAVRPGRDLERKPVAFGSHLDTQPTGGKFDGTLGVLAGLEVIRTLNDASIVTEAPLCLVNWTNEEGSRFAPAMMASGVYSGVLEEDWVLDRRDDSGTSVAEALGAIGYDGRETVGVRDFAAFIELHIEQGPILEAEDKVIGVVEGAQGQIWYDGVIRGMAGHAGTTPMRLRRDALAGLSEIVLASERIARSHEPGVGTIGVATLSHPSRNVIPADLTFSLEFRHPQQAALDEMHGEITQIVKDVSSGRRLDIDFKPIWRSPPVVFDPSVVTAIERATRQLALPFRRMHSGAGHDAVNVARRVPTAMIFVPCKDGISHNEAEDAKPEHCAAGANVLMHTILELAGR